MYFRNPLKESVWGHSIRFAIAIFR